MYPIEPGSSESLTTSKTSYQLSSVRMGTPLQNLRALIKRLVSSPVVWAWAMNGFRMTSGIIVLPLLIHYLPKPEFDMYFVFLSFWALTPIIDFGFVHNFGRAIAYAMAGASRLLPEGYIPEPNAKGPNYNLLTQILYTTSYLYRWFALGTLLFLATLGSWLIHNGVAETPNPKVTWIAWGLMAITIALEVYLAWWNNALMNMNHVLTSLRYTVLANLVRILLLACLIVAGAGLISLPASNLISSILQRALARKTVLKNLPVPIQKADRAAVKSTIKTLWPNTWRTGLHLISGYLSTQAMTLVCLKTLSLATSGMYGFTLTIFNAAVSVSYAWMSVKWPLINQLRIKGQFEELQQILRPRVWLQFLTYWVLAFTIIFAMPYILDSVNTDKSLIPSPWLETFAVLKFFELNFTIWTTLIFTENKLPFLWPTLITNCVAVLLAILMAKFTPLEVGAVILSPLCAGLAYNFWKWPIEALKGINASPKKFFLPHLQSLARRDATQNSNAVAQVRENPR